MRAVIVHPPKPGVEFSDLKEPIRHGKGSVKVRLLENGICGSDREIVRGGRLATSRPPPGKDWLVLGHEAIGIVEESSDPRFKPGELVMPVNRRSYEGHCLNCLVGRLISVRLRSMWRPVWWVWMVSWWSITMMTLST